MKVSMTTLVAGVLVLTGMLSGRAAAQDKVVKIDGSSTVFPITEAVAEDFQKANRGVRVTVGISGTGGGFKKFARGETDISNASRPILQSEIDEAKKNGVEFIELPVAFDALSVVVHKENTWAATMTTDELKKLWEPAAQGKITKWNEINPAWPDAKIELYGAGTDSGTFDYFTEAIVGKAKSSRGDFTASEDDNTTVKGVEGSRFALGYFGLSYYLAHKDKLRAVKIDWIKDGKSVTNGPVEATVENVIGARYNPLSRPMFIYVNRRSAETKPEIKQFVEFFLKHADELVREVNYVPLPASAYELVRSRFAKLETGTAFGGHSEIGLPVDELLKRPLKN